MPRVISLILGGGRGTRLFPLTKSRSKPAVPIAGKYRLIDIPMSNCIHSGLNRIFVLTQFNSVSLHRHIYNTYKFDPFGGGLRRDPGRAADDAARVVVPGDRRRRPPEHPLLHREAPTTWS